MRNQKLDRVIKKILQAYQGVFNHPVRFVPSQLASHLRLSLEQLQFALLKLQREGIIHYQAQKDKPQVVFLRERVNADDLTIDMNLLKFRKERYYKNIQAAIQYAEKNRCRSKLLLAYFNEKEAPLCGQCDVCTGRNKADIDEASYERYKVKIQQLLKKENLTMEEIKEAFSPKRQEQVLTTIQYLLEEGFIVYQEDQLVWK